MNKIHQRQTLTTVLAEDEEINEEESFPSYPNSEIPHRSTSTRHPGNLRSIKVSEFCPLSHSIADSVFLLHCCLYIFQAKASTPKNFYSRHFQLGRGRELVEILSRCSFQQSCKVLVTLAMVCRIYHCEPSKT